MPTWGKRSSPRDMIGAWIFDAELKVLPDGEHQVWLYGGTTRWVFFQPIGCCNKVTCTVDIDLSGDPRGQYIKTIEFDHGRFDIQFDNGAHIEMQWLSSKVKDKMTLDMIKLSKQEIE